MSSQCGLPIYGYMPHHWFLGSSSTGACTRVQRHGDTVQETVDVFVWLSFQQISGLSPSPLDDHLLTVTMRNPTERSCGRILLLRWDETSQQLLGVATGEDEDNRGYQTGRPRLLRVEKGETLSKKKSRASAPTYLPLLLGLLHNQANCFRELAARGCVPRLLYIHYFSCMPHCSCRLLLLLLPLNS